MSSKIHILTVGCYFLLTHTVCFITMSSLYAIMLIYTSICVVIAWRILLHISIIILKYMNVKQCKHESHFPIPCTPVPCRMVSLSQHVMWILQCVPISFHIMCNKMSNNLTGFEGWHELDLFILYQELFSETIFV